MLKLDEKAFTHLIPIALAIVIAFALIFVGSYVNGIIHEELADESTVDEKTLNTMNNTSDNFNAALDIVNVTIIITLLAAAIGAIFAFTRFRG